jgi:glycosyltransferase involved in cell wall biosynthesis
MFPGVENPLRISRYTLARRLSPLFDRALFSALDRANVILACADEDAISRFVASSRGRVARERIVQVPTCVDLTEFHPVPSREARALLGIPFHSPVLVTSGRIGRFKGWELLLEAFAVFQRTFPDSQLIFVGDGEDRLALEAAIAARGLGFRVKITGFQRPREVSCYLNAADAVLFGSLAEGWSVAMLEALACGKPIVSTPVSGVAEMVIPGKNGVVVSTRDPGEYAKAIEDALTLQDAEAASTAIVNRFSLKTFGERLGRLWAPLDLARTEPNDMSGSGSLPKAKTVPTIARPQELVDQL